MCGSNLEAIYDKKLPKRLFPTDYLPDDYTGPNNGSVKDLISKASSIVFANPKMFLSLTKIYRPVRTTI